MKVKREEEMRHMEVSGIEIERCFVNRFSVSLNPYVARIRLGEGKMTDGGGEIAYRRAMVMSTPDAVMLAKMILQLVQESQEGAIPAGAQKH